MESKQYVNYIKRYIIMEELKTMDMYYLIIFVEDNKKPKIIKDILDIKFVNMKLMCLYRNNI